MRRFILGSLLAAAGLLFSGATQTEIVGLYPFATTGTLDVNHGEDAVMWLDFSQDPSGATITSNDGNYTLTVNGTPTRVNDHTWPNGPSASRGYAHWFSGADYYSIADAAGGDDLDAGTSFSIQVALTPTVACATTCAIVYKDNGTTERSYQVKLVTDGVRFRVYKNDTDSTEITTASAVLVDRPLFITATYQYVADGSSEMRLYVNNMATATSSVAVGPAQNTTAAFTIGANDGGAVPLEAHGGFLRIVQGVLTEAEHDFTFAQIQGRVAAGTNYATVASAAPSATQLAPSDSGLEPFLVPTPVNTGTITVIAADRYGLTGMQSTTNLVQRSWFKTCAQNGATEPDGWTVTEVAGAGASDITCDTTHRADVGSAIQFAQTAADSGGDILSACIDIDPTKDYAGYVWAYGVAGDEDFSVVLQGWTDNACTVGDADLTEINEVDLAAGWSRQDWTTAIADWGAIESVKVQFVSTTALVTFWLDAPQFEQYAENKVTHCGGDADASAVCNHGVVSIVPHNLPFGSWSIDVIFNTPWSGATSTTRYLFNIDGTSGTNNEIVMSIAANTLTYAIYDSASALKTATIAAMDATKWPAATDVQVRLWKATDGTFGGWILPSGGSTYNFSAGADAATNSIKNTLSISSTGANHEAYIRNLKLYRTVMR